MKKEAMIRVIMGENIVQLFLKSVLQDTAAFVLLFAVLSFVLRLGFQCGLQASLGIGSVCTVSAAQSCYPDGTAAAGLQKDAGFWSW